jgi:hypothetical protein
LIIRQGLLLIASIFSIGWSDAGVPDRERPLIHAPRPGAAVRVESVETRFWRTRFSGARRLETTHFPADNYSR